jgi:tetratricopeptide (TPR) repeat protein
MSVILSKRLPLLLILVLQASLQIWGETVIVERFTEGNIAYGNRDFAAAETAYREVLATGQSAELHYNLGNALAQQGKWSEAAFHFMRAHSLNPAFEPARANLLLAASQLGLAADYPSLKNPAALLSQSSWTLVASIALWLAIIAFFHRDFVSWRIPLSKSIGTAAIMALLLSTYSILQHQLFQDWNVVSQPMASLRVAPTENSPGDTLLIEGDPIRVLGEQAGFFHVMTTSGDEGFVLAAEIFSEKKD